MLDSDWQPLLVVEQFVEAEGLEPFYAVEFERHGQEFFHLVFDFDFRVVCEEFVDVEFISLFALSLLILRMTMFLASEQLSDDNAEAEQIFGGLFVFGKVCLLVYSRRELKRGTSGVG